MFIKVCILKCPEGHVKMEILVQSLNFELNQYSLGLCDRHTDNQRLNSGFHYP